MKKIILFIATILFLTGAASAETPLKMAFQTSDGQVSSIDAKSLSMIVNGGKLVASNGTETLELELQKLAKMYFTGDVSGLIVNTIDVCDEEVEAYGIDGRFAGKFASTSEALANLPGGVYVMKTTGNKTFKIAVR